MPERIKNWWKKKISKIPVTLVLRYTRHVPDIVEEAYQALAIDEYRAAFAERVWIIPKGKKDDSKNKEDDSKKPYRPKGEQRWFIGAHANVGGGYPNDVLAIIPLHWMQEKATNAGLSFRQCVRIPKDAHFGPITDSYGKFFLGTYRYLPGTWRQRDIGPVGDRNSDEKSPERFNETIDPTALKRIIHDPKEPGNWGEIKEYRPGIARLLKKMEMECMSEDERNLVADAFKQLERSGPNPRFKEDASR